MADKKDKPVVLDGTTDEQGNFEPTLYFALYVHATEKGVRYNALPKYLDVETGRFIKAPLKDDRYYEVISCYFSDSVIDKMIDIAAEKGGEFPNYYIKPLEYSFKTKLKDDAPFVNKDGKMLVMCILSDAEFIREIPNVKLKKKDLF